jgi:hypothetical protein
LKSAAPTLALALLGSLVAIVPALARGAGGGVAVVTLAGSASLVVVPVGLWIRRAREEGRPGSERALLLGTALSSLPLALFGGVLKSTTHHRPLGGATFAVAALLALAACIGLAFRICQVGSARASTRSSFWQSLFIACCALSLAGTLLLALAGQAPGMAGIAADFAALLFASSVSGLVPIPAWLERPRLWLAKVAWSGWVVLVVGAVLTLRSPELARQLGRLSPVLFAPLSWLGVGS